MFSAVAFICGAFNMVFNFAVVCFFIPLFFELYKILFHLLLAAPLIFFLLLYLCFELLFCNSALILQKYLLITFFDVMSTYLIMVFSCSVAVSFWSLVFVRCFSVPFLLFSVHISLVLITFDNCSSLNEVVPLGPPLYRRFRNCSKLARNPSGSL